MNVTRTDREVLNTLSKEVYGSSSRWGKIVRNGVVELVTQELSEIVPGVDGAPDTETVVKVPVKRDDGALQSTVKHYSVEDVRVLMTERKVKLDEFKALTEKNRKEVAARKALSDKVTREAAGSAAV
jgi:hypothetical protein